jgi:hypothetical protein
MNFESNEALSVEASPDGKFVFAGSSTSKIYAFDAATGEMKVRLSGHQWEVHTSRKENTILLICCFEQVWQLELLSVSACVPLLASGSYDHKINLWSLEHPFRLIKSLRSNKKKKTKQKERTLTIFAVGTRVRCTRCALSAASCFRDLATSLSECGARSKQNNDKHKITKQKKKKKKRGRVF